MMINCVKLRVSNEQLTPNTGYFYLTVDNVINRITINGRNVPVNQGDVNNWTVTKLAHVPRDVGVNEGDVVEITGLNQGGPQGILATLYYTDSYGIAKKLSTNVNDWTCGGNKPSQFGANGVGPWGRFPNIDPSAVWIWNGNLQRAGDKTTCRTIVPGKRQPGKGYFEVTVDNVLNSIHVNDRNVPINNNAGNCADWTVTKRVDVPFLIEAGDWVEITGTNQGGPQGILATLYYTDSNGVAKKLSTNVKDWTCGGNKPTEFGANGVAPWGQRFQNIDPSAVWIWNGNAQRDGDQQTCRTRVPGKRRCRDEDQ